MAVTEDKPMRRDPRKQPWQTFPFWFLILSGLAMTVAWKLDLLRPQAAQVATEEATLEDELGPDWASEDIAAEPTAEVEEQTEPVVEGEAPRSFPEGSEPEVAAVDEQSEPATEVATSEEPALEPETKLEPFAKTGSRLIAASSESEKTAEPKAMSLAALASSSAKSVRPQSPFGPARIELKGNRQLQAAKPAAESAERTADFIPDDSSGNGIVQIAAIESEATSDGAAIGQALPEIEEAPAKSGGPPQSADRVDLSTIDQLIVDGEDVEANFQLSNLYWKRPEIRNQLEDRLRAVSYRIYFAPEPHYVDAYVVRPGDVLQNIAKDYNISWEYLAKLNRTDPKKIRPGQKLKVIQGPFAAVVDLSDMELTIHSRGHFVHAFPVGIGQDSSSPMGTFKVLDKLRDPTYYGPNGVIEHDDPQNPLGEYWLDLGDSYGIHGTIDQSSIGKADSLGCIRMKDRDIADVYDLLTKASEVLIRR